MPSELLVSRAKLPHGASYVSPLLPALFLPRAPRLQAASSREIVHMHGIGGDGVYCGDNDAQLGRINVFYHEASGGKYVPRTVFFEPGMIDAVRASPLGELFRPGNLVKTRGTTGPRATSEGLCIKGSDPPLQKG